MTTSRSSLNGSIHHSILSQDEGFSVLPKTLRHDSISEFDTTFKSSQSVWYQSESSRLCLCV